MTNRHGTPIWYELTSADPDASKRFYETVFDWTVGPPLSEEVDYRTIGTGDGNVGGVIRLTDAMAAGGARPNWLCYIGVDDVDAAAAAVRDAGGGVIMGPWQMEGVGRMALVADPQGIPFHVMRGAGDETSTVFQQRTPGKCSWNELATPDPEAARDFYGALFGWAYPDRMSMGAMGDYVFTALGDTMLGAVMPFQPGGWGPGWLFYFRATDIEAAAEAVRAGGGAVVHGPADVPGGDRIIVATDPAGVAFGVVASSGNG